MHMKSICVITHIDVTQFLWYTVLLIYYERILMKQSFLQLTLGTVTPNGFGKLSIHSILFHNYPVFLTGCDISQHSISPTVSACVVHSQVLLIIYYNHYIVLM